MSKSRSNSPTEVDFSVIRTSIDMGHSMIDQILNGIHYGSAEIRRLLREECDFVMECKVCRNLFRSFANFVAHKRVYCIECVEDKKQRDNFVSNELETVVVHPESPESHENQQKDVRVNESVINQVVNRTYKSNSKEYQFYTKVAEKVVNAKTNKVTNTLTLKEIPNTSKAVLVEHREGDHSAQNDNETQRPRQEGGRRQERLSDPKTDTRKKKSTLTEVCTNLLEKKSSITNSENIQKTKSPVVLIQSDRARKSVPKRNVEQLSKSSKTPMEVDEDMPEWTIDTNQIDNDKPNQNNQKNTTPEKMETSPESQQQEAHWIQLCDFENIVCMKCEKTFSSKDNLKLHAKTLHSEKRTMSKCPLCLKELCYFSSVARHLRNVHKKTEVQIAQYRKKMQARSKFVEIIKPESKNKTQLSISTTSVWKGWTKCDKCQKYFSKAKTYRAHLKTRCSATMRAKAQNNVDHANKSKETNVSVIEGIVNENSKNIDGNKKSENTDGSSKVKQPSTSRSSESNNVYKEKILDKESKLYKALTSVNSNPPKVVYVYPKSPLPDTNQDHGKDADKSGEVINNKASEIPKEKIKDSSITRRSTEKERTEMSKEKVRESSSTRNSIEKERTPQTTNSKRETRCRTMEKQVVHTNCSKDTPQANISDSNNSPDIPNPSVSGSHRTKDSLKTSEELNKLKDRLMTEATGKGPSKLEEKSGWSTTTRTRGKEGQMKGSSRKRLRLSLSDIRKERTPVKSPDRFSSSSIRSSETSPIRDSPSSASFPNSPASGDGYSHKFKMSVREMVELVETAGLTKFARERKRHAQTTLNKKSSKEGLSGKLIKPMKRNIRGKKILPVKSYGTRLAAGSRNVGNKIKDGLEIVDRRIRSRLGLGSYKDDKSSDSEAFEKVVPSKDWNTSIKDGVSNRPDDSTSDEGLGIQQIQSKRLSRELKLLANTAGFNERGYYETHTGSEGSSSTEDHSELKQRGDLKDRYVNKGPRDMTAVNILKQKLIAAQKSVSMSKSVMNKRSPDKDIRGRRGSVDKGYMENKFSGSRW